MGEVENYEVFVSLKSDLLTYANVIELIGNLKEDSLRTRHWEKICSLCGIYESCSFLENRSFDEVITILLEKDLVPIADIIKVAVRENEIEKKLNEIKSGLAELTPKYEVNQHAQVRKELSCSFIGLYCTVMLNLFSRSLLWSTVLK